MPAAGESPTGMRKTATYGEMATVSPLVHRSKFVQFFGIKLKSGKFYQIYSIVRLVAKFRTNVEKAFVYKYNKYNFRLISFNSFVFSQSTVKENSWQQGK